MTDREMYDSNPGHASSNKWMQNSYAYGTTHGKFSMAESEKIRRAVKEYCAARNISIARLCSECDHKAELKGAWMEIAKVLPERSVQSVYRHGIRQLHPFKRGLWTEEECEMLEVLVARLGKKWATIQDKLNRSADACRDKYREMGSMYNRGRWKENETELFKRVIREYLNADPTADIKDLGRLVQAKGITIPWSIISKRMGKRARLSCFKKWQKLTGLYSPSDQFKHVNSALGISNNNNSKPDDADVDVDGDDDVDVDVAVPVPSESTVKQSARGRPAKRKATASVTIPTRPTAGEAAALAASGMGNHHPSVSGGDPEMYLLSELANLDVSRMSDVDWGAIRGVDDAQDRWMTLFEEFQESATDDNILSMSLSAVAQMILDQKTSAQQAAETVEAVDLPEV